MGGGGTCSEVEGKGGRGGTACVCVWRGYGGAGGEDWILRAQLRGQLRPQPSGDAAAAPWILKPVLGGWALDE